MGCGNYIRRYDTINLIENKLVLCLNTTEIIKNYWLVLKLREKITKKVNELNRNYKR